MTRILLVDDDPSMRELLEVSLRSHSIDVLSCDAAEAALATLQHEAFDAIVTDVNLGGMTGLALCQRVAESFPDVPVIVMTGDGSVGNAVGALRAHAIDFMTKPLDVQALVSAIERAALQRAADAQLQRLAVALPPSPEGFDGVVGQSTGMSGVLEVLARVANLDVPVLITGESGTGKELVARALHRKSKRREGPFVAINCAAVPAPLLEAELFGVIKGAYTDAKVDRPGLFAQASSGTLFLDEIGDLDVSLQPKLLRALEEHVVRPLGGAKEVPFDARVIAATNRDIRRTVGDGAFREDLFYRLNVVEISLPPLRERGGDILLYAQHFLDHAAASMGKDVRTISSPVAERLLAYAWPGNLRQLKNCIERAVALTQYASLVLEDLPEHIRSPKSAHKAPILDPELPRTTPLSHMMTLDELVGRYIDKVVQAAGGNKTLAAKTLGVNRRTLHRRQGRQATQAMSLNTEAGKAS